MRFEEALFAHLKAFTGLKSLVDERIYPLVLPQKAVLPAVTYQKISGERLHKLQGDTGFTRPVYQLSCWAENYAQCKAVAEQVRLCLQASYFAAAAELEVYKETWVPDWLKAAYPDSNNYRYVTGAITFTHAESQSDWVICTTYDGSTTKYGAVIIGIRNNAASGQVVYGEITRFQPDTIDNVYLNHNETLTLLIADKAGAYKIFAKDANPSATSGNTYYFGVMKLDNPVEPTDVNAWFMFGQNDATKTRFTRQFNAEALGQICEVTCDTLIPESTNFTKNYYNQKIPLARVWAGVADLGMRGYTTNLVIVPQSFIVSNQFYTINGESYYGLGTFDNHIQLPGGGANVGQRVLLKA